MTPTEFRAVCPRFVPAEGDLFWVGETIAVTQPGYVHLADHTREHLSCPWYSQRDLRICTTVERNGRRQIVVKWARPLPRPPALSSSARAERRRQLKAAR